MKVRYSSNFNVEESEVLLDFGCEVTPTNCVYLRKFLLDLEIRKLLFFISIRGVNNKIVQLDEYTLVTIYVIDLLNNVVRKVFLIIKVYIVEDLKANMLIDTNIIISQEMCVDLKIKVYRFDKY